MKQFTILLSLLICYYSLSAQTAQQKSESEKSKIETFSLKTGSLFKKEFKDVGEVKRVKIQSLKITDMLSKNGVSGIKLETSVSKSYGSTEKSCFLDIDEIDAFVKSGKLLIETLANGSPTDYTEFQFTSRGGFQAGAFSSKSDWSYFMKLEKYDSDSYVFLSKDDFSKIINTIEAAKPLL